MWTIYSKNRENGKVAWECGFGWRILRRIEKLTKTKINEILFIDKLEINWNNFLSCLFKYRGTIDEESLEAEGTVEQLLK